MNSLEVLKNIYKPFKYTKIGKSTIINTTSGDYVIKTQDSEIKKLFNYLSSRNFNNFPLIVDDSRKDVTVYKYIEDIQTPKEQKSIDMINLVSNLHNKTTYFKEVSKDTYKEIFDDVMSNIDYYKEYYSLLYDSLFKEEFHSPSHYLFLVNYYKLDLMLDFCKNELNNWYEIVKEKNVQRVCVIHNNLSLSHFIKNNPDYLISWDKAKIDTPVLDLVQFYRTSYLDFNFKKVLDIYLSNYPLQDDEKKLFFILISIPFKIELDKNSELQNVKDIRKKLDYVFKTEDLIRPYYSGDKEE